MGQTASELKETVAARRADVSRDLDALGEKLSPGRALDRTKGAARSRFRDMRESVMGSASDVKDDIAQAPRMAERRLRGNPLAAGLIAFGGGLVLASVLPKSQTEQELARTANEGIQQAASQVRSAGEDMAVDLRDAAQSAVDEMKSTAQEAGHHMADDAKSSAQHVSHPR